MKWLTISQIKHRSKTAKGALKVSYEHWDQLYTAMAKELRVQLEEQENLIFCEYCGLCIYHSDKNGQNRKCKYCVFSPYCPRPSLTPLWGTACDALRQWQRREIGNNRQNWHAWKRASKALRDKLKELMDK